MDEQATKFIGTGLTNYSEGLRTIAHFEAQVQQIAMNALSQHLTGLSDAMGLPFLGNEFRSWIKYDAPQITWSRIEMYLTCDRSLGWVYAGIRWQRDANGRDRAYAAVDVQTASAPARNNLIAAAAKVLPPPRFTIENPSGNELVMRVEVTEEGAANIQTVLSEILSEWERLFHAIGGIGALDATP